MPRKLTRAFYRRPAEELAAELIGTILVHRDATAGTERRARIVETEAYVGPHDLACHAAKGRTGRTDIMFGPPGFAYVYLIYGMYDMLNVVCADEGDAQAVLIRAAEPLGGFGPDVSLSGPGKLARAMSITRPRDNGRDLTGDVLFFLTRVGAAPRIARTPRIGVDYAGDEWAAAMLRFVDADSPALSRRIIGESGRPTRKRRRE